MLVDVQLSGSPVVVDDLDDAFLLALLRESEQQKRIADRRQLRLARAWAERHPARDEREVAEAIGGEGTPAVSERAVTPLATALGVSAQTGAQLLSDALDLTHRLPRIDAGVEALQIAPWRARRIAKLTHGLSQEAAAYVDARIAPVADSCGVVRIEREVAEAIARFDTVEQAESEDEAEAAWGVRLEDYRGPVWDGTSRLEVIGDTPTLRTLYDLINATAHELLDPDLPPDQQSSLAHRKVAALRRIAAGAGASSHTRLYLHVGADDLEHPLANLGQVERLGPLTVARLQHLLGTTRFTVRPVLDLARADAVDEHDPPAWMRELVVLRDRTCVHPHCDKPARDCDLDHIEPYVEMDDGGPPGQTRPDNLAPLCRRHHRAKTHHGWTYRRNGDGSYTWTSPFGERCTVDTRGVVTRH